MAAIDKELAQLDEWLAYERIDAAVREELESLKHRYTEEPESAAEEIADRFYRFMEFGTAGMRGIMGAGSNRINIHTIRKITQGYADFLNGVSTEKRRPARVVIAYDNRRHSDLFAFESAMVFVANGIETHMFKQLSVTPLLSFAARELKADGGVVLTASHNNKYYNGYKIYDGRGCQCLPDDAGKVAALIDGVDMWHGVKTISDKYPAEECDETGYTGATPGMLGRMKRAEVGERLFWILPESMVAGYIDRVFDESLTPGALADIRAVYTPLNGAGNMLVQVLLKKAGIGELHLVKEQEHPDPDFATVPEPNPEKAEALALGLALCEKLAGEGKTPDILIGTDPDSDRLGAAVLHEGNHIRLTGNQVGVLILDYIITCREKYGSMPGCPVFVTTIVSTPITGKMAEKHGIETRKVLTGFKNIGDQMNKLETAGEENRYIFGFEESCGYLSGIYCRDKDAQNAALLLLEAAGAQKKAGKTLLDRVDELYAEYGYYIEGLDEFVRPGEKGMREIADIMKKMRREENRGRFGSAVVGYTDYLDDKELRGDVVQFDLADGCRILARPSGTEPKLKIYYTGVGSTQAAAEAAIARMKEEIAGIVG